jgi:hypothetical protein
MMDELQQRFDLLLHRLSTAYDGIGHSSGRPYLYFVYPPAQERQVQRMLDEQMRGHPTLSFLCIDILEITISSLAGQEERRQQFLNDPLRSQSQTEAILRVWARKLSEKIATELASQALGKRPVAVLYNLAALHPLGDPTSLMEFLAEREPRNPQTGAMVPITLLVPGSRPPQSSRTYLFLEQIQLDFYRGEEI